MAELTRASAKLAIAAVILAMTAALAPPRASVRH